MPARPLRFKNNNKKFKPLRSSGKKSVQSESSGTRAISNTSVAPVKGSGHASRCNWRAFALLIAMGSASGVFAQERIVVDLPLPPPSTARPTLPPAPPRTPPTRGVDLAQANNDAPESSDSRLLLTLQSGESLYHVFTRHQLNQADLVDMASDRRIKKRLRRLQPGQRIAVHASPQGRIHRVYLQAPGPRDQVIERGERGFALRDIPDADDFITSTPAVVAPASTTIDEPMPASAPEQLAAEIPGAPELAALGTEQEDSGPPSRDGTDAPLVLVEPEYEQRAEHADTAIDTDIDTQADADSMVRNVTVQSGDSLYAIFKRSGVPPTELARLLEAGKEAQQLRRLRPGQEVILRVSERGQLHDLSVSLDETQTLRAVRSGENFTVEVEHEPLEHRSASASAVIEDALFLAGQREGLSDRLIMELVEIFGWDVDFALDVRAGDHFTVLYDELFKDGVKVRDGHILAAEFVNRGRTIRAIRFVDETGRAEYFSPQGLSMRKAFLRTPVEFSRISSRFSIGRMHPVLQRMRAHKGVDYAAPTGTPVRAAGNGRVEVAGWKGGYGTTVVLQHGSTYTTLYAHLSRLHPGMRSGVRVRQGDIIGYVGQTGLATGPHLHYEFRVRGVHQDPLQVKLPEALPIEDRYKRAFLRESAPLVVKLDSLARTRLASRD